MRSAAPRYKDKSEISAQIRIDSSPRHEPKMPDPKTSVEFLSIQILSHLLCRFSTCGDCGMEYDPGRPRYHDSACKTKEVQVEYPLAGHGQAAVKTLYRDFTDRLFHCPYCPFQHKNVDIITVGAPSL